ncbi:methyltransferase domain-containing protein [Candidatus Dependentiae bacterium]|nr:MAG: methyltransferase domain-containing protein [Candidatus Dependentiae bacterium]
MKNYRSPVLFIPLIATLFLTHQIKSNNIGDITKFVKGFVKNPFKVGSILPCSSYVGEEIIKYYKKQIMSHHEQPIHILEVGAGTGSLTEVIVKYLRHSDHLDIIEISPDFCTILQEKFGNYQNVSIHCNSITEWQPSYQYDFIICTLPFVSFEKSFMNKVIDHLLNIIKSGGIFSYVSFAGIANLKKPFLKKQAQNDHKEKMSRLKKLRELYQIDSKTILQNCPPIRVYHLLIN